MDNNPKKIGILTLHGYQNYGNKLQNYALQKIINSLGFEANTVIIRKNRNVNNILSRRIKTVFKTSPSKIIGNLIERKKQKAFYKNNKELIDNRTRTFKDFSRKYLNEKFFFDSDDDYDNLIKSYEYFIAGSDQVWNPIYINDMNNYFLTFAPNERRISYAASFSCLDIPDKYKDKYKNWILGMAKISVRERVGANIIKHLTGIDVPVLLDPTLLLSKEQWISISKKSTNKPEEGYILAYFLGKIDEETKLYIESIAKIEKLKLIYLADIKDCETYTTGPSEFIDYVSSATVLFTDSFHGVVFSILMQTPFVVFQRLGTNMYSRIETLLDMFHLRSREVQNIKNNEQIFNMDFSHIKPILEQERKKAIDYLKEALNVKNEN